MERAMDQGPDIRRMMDSLGDPRDIPREVWEFVLSRGREIRERHRPDVAGVAAMAEVGRARVEVRDRFPDCAWGPMLLLLTYMNPSLRPADAPGGRGRMSSDARDASMRAAEAQEHRAGAPSVSTLLASPEWILARSRVMYAEASAPGVTSRDRWAIMNRHQRAAEQAYVAEFGEPPGRLGVEMTVAALREDQPEVFREIFGDGDGHSVPVVRHELSEKVRQVLPGITFVVTDDPPEDHNPGSFTPLTPVDQPGGRRTMPPELRDALSKANPVTIRRLIELAEEDGGPPITPANRRIYDRANERLKRMVEENDDKEKP
jgi:hypothetical protein